MPRAPKEKLVMEGTVEIIVEKQTRTKDKECTRQKASQVRKPTSNNSETLKNWGCLFANQNVEYMKRMQSKSTKNVESKEAPKKSFVSHAQEQRKKESHMVMSIIYYAFYLSLVCKHLFDCGLKYFIYLVL